MARRTPGRYDACLSVVGYSWIVGGPLCLIAAATGYTHHVSGKTDLLAGVVGIVLLALGWKIFAFRSSGI